MDELDLFRDFRRGADAPSADAQRRASDRLESMLAQAPRAQAGHRRRRRRSPYIVLAATSLVLVVGTASAFGTVRDLFLGDSGERNLTGDGTSSPPVWSPDGRKIAFGSDSRRLRPVTSEREVGRGRRPRTA
jgi:WD40-like Beta Propeller Repeat